MILIEIGGLGVMTFSVVFFLFLGRGFSTRGRWIITESFTAAPVRNIKSLLKSIFLFTFLAEVVGALLLFGQWRGRCPPRPLSSRGSSTRSPRSATPDSRSSDELRSVPGSILLNATICTLIVLGASVFP